MKVRKEAYVQIFEKGLPDGKDLATIVMDKEEFDELCEEIKKQKPTGMTDEHVEMLKRANFIPLMAKGSKTRHVFEKYKIREGVERVSVIVRGEGRKIMGRVINGVL